MCTCDFSTYEKTENGLVVAVQSNPWSNSTSITSKCGVVVEPWRRRLDSVRIRSLLDGKTTKVHRPWCSAVLRRALPKKSTLYQLSTLISITNALWNNEGVSERGSVYAIHNS